MPVKKSAAKAERRSPQGRKRVPNHRAQAIRARVAEVVADMGGKSKAARLLGFSERSIEGWISSGGRVAPDSSAVIQFAEEAFINPQWLLLGTGPKHFNVSRAPSELNDDLRREVRALLHSQGHDAFYVDRYFPSAQEMLDELVETTARLIRKRRRRQRIALARAIHEALEEGAMGGYGPILAKKFSTAFYEAKTGERVPDGSAVVDPLFSLPSYLDDGEATGRTGSHVDIVRSRKARRKNAQ